MCGIAGILRRDGTDIPDATLDALDRVIAHRGPDGADRFRDRVTVGGQTLTVGLVHRRLSIIDHAGGSQPMVSPRGRHDDEGLVAVVFNGCIYNHRDLRRELESAGHRFASDHSDTEVLLHGYRQWGGDLPEHLEGMYAFAVWDRDHGRLLLARDRFGEKPLHYRVRRDASGVLAEIAFATSRGALGGPVDDAAAGDLAAWTTRYLQLGYGWGRDDPPEGSGTRRLPAGGRLLAETGLAAARLPTPPPPSGAATVEAALEAAVASRLEADVPLGCFLSGGVDSSLVARFARTHRPDLRTFSVRMPDPRFDESKHAERVAQHLGTDHTTLDVAPAPATDLPRLITELGQPFADSSILPTHWVSRAAREHVAVALSGDGGDELFLGYERYLAAPILARHWRWLQWLPSGLRRGAHPRSRRDKLGRLGGMARAFPTLGVLATESLFEPDGIATLMGAAFDATALARVSPAAAPITRLRDEDLERYLPEDLLLKVDTAAMSVALEVRCPFLDRDLAAAALNLPVTTLLDGGRKGLLRRIARAHLPAAVVDRPKMGFAVPIGEWFRTDHGQMRTQLNDHLRSPEPFGPLPIESAPVHRLIDEHDSQRRDHGQRLFALLTLSMWARGVLGGRRFRRIVIPSPS